MEGMFRGKDKGKFNILNCWGHDLNYYPNPSAIWDDENDSSRLLYDAYAALFTVLNTLHTWTYLLLAPIQRDKCYYLTHLTDKKTKTPRSILYRYFAVNSGIEIQMQKVWLQREIKHFSVFTASHGCVNM